jgi:hypothetical protein
VKWKMLALLGVLAIATTACSASNSEQPANESAPASSSVSEPMLTPTSSEESQADSSAELEQSMKQRQDWAKSLENEILKYTAVDDRLGIIIQAACSGGSVGSPDPDLVGLYKKYWLGSSKRPSSLYNATQTPAGCPFQTQLGGG